MEIAPAKPSNSHTPIDMALDFLIGAVAST